MIKALPKTIARYSLVDSLTESDRSFSLGIYKTSKGQQVVAKMWLGGKYNLKYFALRHEINVYKVLTAIYNRNAAKLPPNLKKINFPHYVDTYDDGNKLVLITKWFTGRPLLSTRSLTKQLDCYKRCVGFMAYLGSKATKHERALISHRSGRTYLALYLFLLCVALGKHPKYFLSLIKGLAVMLQSISALLEKKDFALIHGDLHLENILVTPDSIIILDLEQSLFTYPEYEIISTLLCANNPSTFFNQLTSNLFKAAENDPKRPALVAALLVNRITHYLTGSVSNKKKGLFLLMLKLAVILSKRTNKFYVPAY